MAEELPSYKPQKWTEYDDTKTELQNIERGAVPTSERMNNIENGIATNSEGIVVANKLIATKQNIIPVSPWEKIGLRGGAIANETFKPEWRRNGDKIEMRGALRVPDATSETTTIMDIPAKFRNDWPTMREGVVQINSRPNNDRVLLMIRETLVKVVYCNNSAAFTWLDGMEFWSNVSNIPK